MSRFDHEKLEAYRVAIEFVAWVQESLDGPLAGCGLSVVKQLDRASTSIALNIAEGNGKRSAKDRCRYLDTSRGSALECAAFLDVAVARRAIANSLTEHGKQLLVRIVQMLSKMIARLEGASSTSTSTSTSTA